MRILIIEDEVKLALAIKKALTLSGYTVDIAHDGEAGLDLAYDEGYDLIILDWMLPEKSGPEISEELRREKIKTPIIFLTALDQIENRVRGLDCGADDYLAKPFAMAELLARVRALTRRPKTMPQNLNIKYQNLLIDQAACQVLVNDTVVPLSSKELALLTYLLENQGIALSKEKIVENIWNYEADVLPSTVEVHIKNLRSKLAKVDPLLSQNLIQTIRGHGYLVAKQKKEKN